MKEQTILHKFTKYVSLNILGMLGLSCYILADTFFVSNALGVNGLSSLNFALPIFSIIVGSGLMIGIGGATKYTVLVATNQTKKANEIFTHCIILGSIFSIIFVLLGIFCAEPIAVLFGANGKTLPLTIVYLNCILLFAPCFVFNNIIVAFVRNDNAPQLAMSAMLISSFSNIILDYIFVYPMNMGIFGAAFATGLSPFISLLVISTMFFKKKNNFKMINCKTKLINFIKISVLGGSAFITEFSSTIVIITFNLVIFNLSGNTGVAAYGIIANIALVATSIFNGVAQGIQPIVSYNSGIGNSVALKKILKYAIVTSLAISFVIYTVSVVFSNHIILIFNSENNLSLAQIAKIGINIYFAGFFFSGLNVIIAAFLSAKQQASVSFVISLLRGCVLLVPFVLLFSALFKLNGVWLSFVATELVVFVVAMLSIKKSASVKKL